jgi:acyl-CoA hydrolase
MSDRVPRARLRLMEPRSPSESHSDMTRWMGVQEANIAGNVHGGWIMKLCDEVAGIAAIRHCGRRVVTAGVDRMTFLHPVMVGDLVVFRATVNAAWRTSMEVGVRVEAENVHTRELTHASTAYLTMVALDEEGPGRGAADRARDRRRAPPAARGAAAPQQPAGGARPDRGGPQLLRGLTP